MQLQSCYPVICTEKVQETALFFVNNFEFEVTYESDWYISLRSKINSNFELAMLDYNHPSVPAPYRNRAAGVLINYEVSDVDKEYEKLVQKGLSMILDIRSEEWGQRHFIVEDPNGILIDVIQNTPPSPEFAADYV